MKTTYKTIIYISFIVFIAACSVTKKETFDDKKETFDDSPPPVGLDTSFTYEKVEPVALTPSTVKEFVLWASGSELNEREIIRKEMLKASRDEEVLKLLFEEFTVNTKDIGYSLVVLSIIGEMQNPNSLPSLEKIIYKELPEQKENLHGVLTERDFVAMLSSKAVECAAYLKTEESNRLILNVASKHPSQTVRSTAIDAYLFNNGDSEEAKNTLKQIVQKSDIILIDRTRFVRNSNREEFNDKLSLFYKLHPDEIAPEPEPPTVIDRKKDSVEIVQPINPPKRKQK